MNAFEELFAAMPSTTICAALFYLSMVLVFFSPAGTRLKGMFFVTAPSTGRYVEAYDSLRGILAIWVAMGHLAYAFGGRFLVVMNASPCLLQDNRYAVPFFCSLSGLLIYRSLLKIQDVEGVRFYLIRRFLRVYPVYLVTSICAMFFFSHPMTVGRVVAELLMLRSIGYPGYLNPPSWSLYVEVLFYLVMPVIVFTFRKRMLYFSAIAIILLWIGEYQSFRELELWKFFFAGILSSELLDRFRDRIKLPIALGLICIGVALVIFVTYSSVHHGHYTLGYSERSAAACLAVPLVLVGLSALPANPVLNNTLLRIVGASSYSLYLWHYFIVALDDPSFKFTGTGGSTEALAPALNADPFFVFWFVLLPAVLFVAMVSFLVVERPCLALRPRPHTVARNAPSSSNA